MTIKGQCPQIMYGESLAAVYPNLTRFTYPSVIKQFATLRCILGRAYTDYPDILIIRAQWFVTQ